MRHWEHELEGLVYAAVREADAPSWQLTVLQELGEAGLARRREFGPGVSPDWVLSEDGIDYLANRS